ncbi:MAG: hypothetical protein K2P80_04695 [Beijerinckiaceae bacterium]|nr:hypothetical protein [Beijerinckiaceae bacterium]
MNRFNDAIATFEHAIGRAQQMISLYDALVALRPRESANDDALRSAYFQTVSSFDFFVHEAAAIEARYRFENAIRTRNIVLPMNVIIIQDEQDRIDAVEQCIREQNSYKAFVDPGKLAELLSCFCYKPWQKICSRINQGCEASDIRTADQIKGQLRNIWRRRNLIAHSADVNPTQAGIGLWPIDKEDTQITIEFIKKLGEHLPNVISQTITDEELAELEES